MNPASRLEGDATKAKELTLHCFFSCHLLLVGNAYFALHCSKPRISRSVSRHQYISVLSNGKSRVFDRRAMDTDRSSQEGREDMPSELSFLVSAPQADPTPVMTRPSEGTRPEPTSAMVTRSCAREGRGISVAPEAEKR